MLMCRCVSFAQATQNNCEMFLISFWPNTMGGGDDGGCIFNAQPSSKTVFCLFCFSICM